MMDRVFVAGSARSKGSLYSTVVSPNLIMSGDSALSFLTGKVHRHQPGLDMSIGNTKNGHMPKQIRRGKVTWINVTSCVGMP